MTDTLTTMPSKAQKFSKTIAFWITAIITLFFLSWAFREGPKPPPPPTGVNNNLIMVPYVIGSTLGVAFGARFMVYIPLKGLLLEILSSFKSLAYPDWG
jgi:hypothetical protein